MRAPRLPLARCWARNSSIGIRWLSRATFWERCWCAKRTASARGAGSSRSRLTWGRTTLRRTRREADEARATRSCMGRRATPTSISRMACTTASTSSRSRLGCHKQSSCARLSRARGLDDAPDQGWCAAPSASIGRSTGWRWCRLSCTSSTTTRQAAGGSPRRESGSATRAIGQTAPCVFAGTRPTCRARSRRRGLGHKSSPAEPPPVSRHAWWCLEQRGLTAGVNPAHPGKVGHGREQSGSLPSHGQRPVEGSPRFRPAQSARTGAKTSATVQPSGPATASCGMLLGIV